MHEGNLRSLSLPLSPGRWSTARSDACTGGQGIKGGQAALPAALRVCRNVLFQLQVLAVPTVHLDPGVREAVQDCPSLCCRASKVGFSIALLLVPSRAKEVRKQAVPNKSFQGSAPCQECCSPAGCNLSRAQLNLESDLGRADLTPVPKWMDTQTRNTGGRGGASKHWQATELKRPSRSFIADNRKVIKGHRR